MSLIAGLYGPDGFPNAQARHFLYPVWLGPAETRAMETAGKALLLQAGTEPVVARLGTCLAVVDGGFCNTSALPPAPTPAGRFLALHEKFGFEAALARVCGEFVVALYDGAADTLWLARDRIGVKPCYYALTPAGFAFASRPGPLLGLPGVSHRVNPAFAALFAASHYRVFDNDPDASPYADVRQLPAGFLACCREGGTTLRRWWTVTDAPDWEDDEETLAERYRALLLTAVGERFALADAPAFTLSGGLDSSSVLASVVHRTGQRQHAFSSVYEDKTFDESEEIASMLQANVAVWHPVRIGQVDIVAHVDAMVAAHDEPVATATWLSHWLVCREAAAAGFRTLFGGLGGDELNAGEYEYFLFFFADLKRAGKSEALAAEVAAWAGYHDHPLWRKNAAMAEAAMAVLTDPHTPGRCLPNRARLERYAAALRPGVFDLAAFTPAMESPFASYLKNRTWQDIRSEAAPCCLRAEDRQTRAFGLTNMDPFYDHRLVEFMFRVPGTSKIRHGVTKHLLRQAMRGILPDETRQRIKKTGWNAPAHVWFTGRQAEVIRDMVSSADFKAGAFYHIPEVLRLLDNHCDIVASGAVAENHMMFFWQLVNLEAWLRYVNRLEAIMAEKT